MVRTTCAGCGRTLTIATGRENVWVLEGRATLGLTLELGADERTVCFSCIERLPPNPTVADVDALPTADDA